MWLFIINLFVKLVSTGFKVADVVVKDKKGC